MTEPNISSTPKIAYIYDKTGDSWHPIAGSADPASPYTWTNTQTFNGSVTFSQSFLSRKGINNFQNEAERSTLFPNPEPGAISFLRNSSRIEFWNKPENQAGFWQPLGTTTATANSLVRRDANSAITANSFIGKATSAGAADTAISLTTGNERKINGRQFNGNTANFIVNPTTYLTKGTSNVLDYRRIFVRNDTTTPTGTIDNISPATGDIYIGW
jgi:hypothetical protein